MEYKDLLELIEQERKERLEMARQFSILLYIYGAVTMVAIACFCSHKFY